ERGAERADLLDEQWPRNDVERAELTDPIDAERRRHARRELGAEAACDDFAAQIEPERALAGAQELAGAAQRRARIGAHAGAEHAELRCQIRAGCDFFLAQEPALREQPYPVADRGDDLGFARGSREPGQKLRVFRRLACPITPRDD